MQSGALQFASLQLYQSGIPFEVPRPLISSTVHSVKSALADMSMAKENHNQLWIKEERLILF